MGRERGSGIVGVGGRVYRVVRLSADCSERERGAGRQAEREVAALGTR